MAHPFVRAAAPILRLAVLATLTALIACGGGDAAPTGKASPTGPSSPPPRMVSAGVMDDYESGEPVHFYAERFWVVRLGDDLVLALSDRDTHPEFAGKECRIVWREDVAIDERPGWFRGRCSGSVFNVNGRLNGGPSPRSMDRFGISVVDGAVTVDTGLVLDSIDVQQLHVRPKQFPELSAEDAVYLSLGDSIQYGCCADPQRSAHPTFAEYLSERLNRPVRWVTLAGNDTTAQFIDGAFGEAPQLDRAVELLEQYRLEGRDVVAITLSIGGNDLLELRPICQGRASPECIDRFRQILERYQRQLDVIMGALNAAKQPQTPIFQLNVYDAYDCGRTSDKVSASAVGVQIFNGGIAGVTRLHGAQLIDMNAAFRRKACEYVIDVDPTYSGYALIAGLYQAAYEALPPEFVEPFIRPEATQ